MCKFVSNHNIICVFVCVYMCVCVHVSIIRLRPVQGLEDAAAKLNQAHTIYMQYTYIHTTYIRVYTHTYIHTYMAVPCRHNTSRPTIPVHIHIHTHMADPCRHNISHSTRQGQSCFCARSDRQRKCTKGACMYMYYVFVCVCLYVCVYTHIHV